MSENKSLIGIIKTLDDYISKLQQCGLKKDVHPESKVKQISQDMTNETNKENSNVITMTIATISRETISGVYWVTCVYW